MVVVVRTTIWANDRGMGEEDGGLVMGAGAKTVVGVCSMCGDWANTTFLFIQGTQLL